MHKEGTVTPSGVRLKLVGKAKRTDYMFYDAIHPTGG